MTVRPRARIEIFLVNSLKRLASASRSRPGRPLTGHPPRSPPPPPPLLLRPDPLTPRFSPANQDHSRRRTHDAPSRHPPLIVRPTLSRSNSFPQTQDHSPAFPVFAPPSARHVPRSHAPRPVSLRRRSPAYALLNAFQKEPSVHSNHDSAAFPIRTNGLGSGVFDGFDSPAAGTRRQYIRSPISTTGRLVLEEQGVSDTSIRFQCPSTRRPARQRYQSRLRPPCNRSGSSPVLTSSNAIPLTSIRYNDPRQASLNNDKQDAPTPRPVLTHASSVLHIPKSPMRSPFSPSSPHQIHLPLNIRYEHKRVRSCDSPILLQLRAYRIYM